MRRKASLYAVIGGIVGAVLTMAVGHVMPIGAHNQSDVVFGKITCTGLKVVNAEGLSKITLGGSERGGMVVISDEAERHVVLTGRSIRVSDRKGDSVRLAGGNVFLVGKAGLVSISISEQGGMVYALGKDGKGVARLGSNEYGGFVTVGGKGGSVRLRTDKHGGRVNVFGEGDDTGTRASMGVSEYGNGAVSIWDKNGYRLATLK